MGGAASTPAQRKETLRKMKSGLVYDIVPKDTFLEDWNQFVQNDRYEVSISFNNTPNWADQHAADFFLTIPGVDDPVDLRSYIAHRIASLNWVNTLHQVNRRYCLSYEDKQVIPATVTKISSTGKETHKSIEIRIIIKGDEEYQKATVEWPEVVAPCKELVLHAKPCWKFADNSIRLNSPGGKQFALVTSIGDNDATYPQPESITGDMLQATVDRYYAMWNTTEAAKVFKSYLQAEYDGKLQKKKTFATFRKT
eukprot:NODE_3068_length_946_cov_104.547009_g3048_i0.p1 GENE.NODE_3068_length_946_cov_104.547009_g3048_i0~~NODE_3068_length_946_cov_104.547009_g3048_i0.p1  ORF type:complete len:253 (+),score=46.63 NODE_3068_length_946_cov_104.547009_g3048_i0:75-833(+)